MSEDRRARDRRYRERHKEEISNYNRAWRKANREKISIYCRAWQNNNPKKRAAILYRWLKKNPVKNRAKVARHTARKKALPDTLTPEQAEHLLAIGRAVYPGEELHLDHIVPVNKGGGTTLANMHAIPAKLNRSKQDKLPQEIYCQQTLFWDRGGQP